MKHMFVVHASNCRNEEPIFEMTDLLSNKNKEWIKVFKRNSKYQVMVTGLNDWGHGNFCMTLSGIVYRNVKSSLINVRVNKSILPITSVDTISRSGNKISIELKFYVSLRDVTLINSDTCNFDLILPNGFTPTSFVSSNSPITYIGAIISETYLLATEVSPFSFTLLLPELKDPTEKCKVKVESTYFEVMGSKFKVNNVQPDTIYNIQLIIGPDVHEIELKTPEISKDSLLVHYRSCGIASNNSVIYDLSDTSHQNVKLMRTHGIIRGGDRVIIRNKDDPAKKYELSAICSGETTDLKGSLYIIPDFETDDVQRVCLDHEFDSHVVEFDKTESYVRVTDSDYSFGEKFMIGSKEVTVCEGSIILVVYDDVPQTLPGGTATAAQIITSGDLIIRDLIMQSSYQVTPKVSGSTTYGKNSMYVYNPISDTTLETTRISHGLDDSETTGSMIVDLLYTDSSSDQLMHRSLEVEPSFTNIKTTNSDTNETVTATFDADGFKFNSDSADIYFGANHDFRIHYEPDDGTNPSMLQIQGYDSSSSTYVTRFLVSNEKVN